MITADGPGRAARSRGSTDSRETSHSGPHTVVYWLPALQSGSDAHDVIQTTPDYSKDHSIFKTAGIDEKLDRRARDPWIGWDKVQHVTFSFLFTVGSQYALVNKAGMGERDALPVSMGVSGAIGLAKELNDRYRSPSRYFSERDLVADAVGILVAAGFILL